MLSGHVFDIFAPLRSWQHFDFENLRHRRYFTNSRVLPMGRERVRETYKIQTDNSVRCTPVSFHSKHNSDTACTAASGAHVVRGSVCLRTRINNGISSAERVNSDKETLKYSLKAKATVRNDCSNYVNKKKKKKGKETSRKLKPNVDGSRRGGELKKKRSDCVKKDWRPWNGK